MLVFNKISEPKLDQIHQKYILYSVIPYFNQIENNNNKYDLSIIRKKMNEKYELNNKELDVIGINFENIFANLNYCKYNLIINLRFNENIYVFNVQ